MRTPNKYCHTTKDVLEHLLTIEHEVGEDSEWWDYVTAIRGCDMYDSSKMTKYLFTCVIRGMGGESGADDIQETIDTFSLQYSVDKNSGVFPNVRKLIHSDAYGHFNAHIYCGLKALCRYYNDMKYKAHNEKNKNDAQIYKKCSDLCEKMSEDIIQCDNSDFDNYCTHLYKFLELVSDEA